MAKENSVTRRSVLGGLGAGIFGVSSRNSPTATRKKRLVIARDQNGPIEVEHVSKEWWRHRNHVHSVKNRLLEKYDSLEGVVGAGVDTSDRVIGLKKGFKVIMKVKSNLVSSRIPSSYEGITVDTQMVTQSERLGCYNDGPYSTLKGGVFCEEDPSTVNYATTGPMVERNGTNYLLTCWHMYDSSNDHYCDNVDGDSFYHQGTHFGNVADSYHTNDWAIVNVDSSNMTDGILTSHDNTVHEIGGWFTPSGMDSAKSNGRKFYRQGVTSGYTSGYIGETNVDISGPEGCIYPDYCTSYTIDSAPGDSGGPVFSWGHNNPDNAVLAGWVSWGTGQKGSTDGCTTDNLAIYEQIYGPLMYTLDNKHNITPV